MLTMTITKVTRALLNRTNLVYLIPLQDAPKHTGDTKYREMMSLLQKLTTERTENTEHKELMSKRILERFLRQNFENFIRYLINFC